MKYKVRVSELRYGEVEVEAASEREAKNKATRAGFNIISGGRAAAQGVSG